MHLKASLVAVAFIAMFSSASAADEPTDCDRLAASTNDIDRKAPGVLFDKLDGKAAETACRAAIADSDDVQRFMFQLGRALDRQDRFAEAKAAYRAAFEEGYAPAFHAYGKLFELGLGSDVDYAKAGDYYQKALDAGMKYAAGDLAYLHDKGLGFTKDPALAAPLYRIAAEAGDGWSQVHLGFLYENGNGVPKDASEAVKWYRAASDQGEALGQFDLALMYEDGKGVTKDINQAFRLLRLAEAQDNGLAARELARFYRYGIVVTKDGAEAERLWRKAIETGEDDTIWEAQNELAWMLATDGRNLAEAATLVGQALDKAPHDHADYPAALDTSALVQHLQGKNDAALQTELQAVALQADFAPFHDRLGDIYAALGRKDEARAEWQKALDLPAPDADRNPEWNRDAVAGKLNQG
jgi:TPR repeat protein